jgi:hypothetical protein
MLAAAATSNSQVPAQASLCSKLLDSTIMTKKKINCMHGKNLLLTNLDTIVAYALPSISEQDTEPSPNTNPLTLILTQGY